MSNEYDNQLIESVTVRRRRLGAALLYGSNPQHRRWVDGVRRFIFSIVVAAVIGAGCVGFSFVSNLIKSQPQLGSRSAPAATPTNPDTASPHATGPVGD
ncbi:hypothetical protein [Spelaeicoccus albus]|uniref:Uncharacterized protein n=1 Tax=Spelaeicoccus albus TaxID=1280376 RepID=A0A7Z0D012_9MICO|nr:hypothetical protein [Spelaeicoccus albus]NYI66804.1 hypothetical protein [Spelaeicoccus albus]